MVVFQSDTEFWDKMQAEWEELARRNWLEESEDQGPIPPTVSPAEKVGPEPAPFKHEASLILRSCLGVVECPSDGGDLSSAGA